HNRQEDRSRDGIEDDRVESRQESDPGRYPIADFVENSPDFPLRCLDFGRGRHWKGFDFSGFFGEAVLIDGLDQCALTAGADSNRFDYRYAQRVFERLAVESVASLFGDVAHVEGDDHRPADALEVQDQA